MLLILKSLAVVLSISTALGLIAHYLFGITFLGVFLTGIIIQFLGSYFLNTWIESRERKVAADREEEIIKEFNKQGTTVSCAYCGEPNFVAIRTDLPNDFKCGKCEEENAVYISITAAQRTNPLQSSPLEVLSYNTQLEAARDKVLGEEDGQE